MAALLWSAATLALVTMPGCSGCTGAGGTGPQAKKSQEELEKELMEKRKKREERKPDFEIGRLQLLPLDSTQQPGEREGDDKDDRGLSRNAQAKANESLRTYPVKPGHWVTAQQDIKANNFDFQADLETLCVDSMGRPLRIERTPFAMSASRPAPLPKGQLKTFETVYSIPRIGPRQQAVVLNPNASTGIALQCQLRARRGGGVVNATDQREFTTPMPAYQYLIVVLASEPSSYGYLKTTGAVDPPDSEFTAGDAVRYYQVATPLIEKRLPVPSHPLTWTSIAYVVWDGANPTLATPEQQDAMLDWIHFGGQLVISGPQSMDTLRGTFLEPYLPAKATATRPLTDEDFASIDSRFSLRSMKETRQGDEAFNPAANNPAAARANQSGRVLSLDVLDDRPPLGVELELADGGSFMPEAGKLVAERRVGRGRIVVTAFSLNDAQIVNDWKCFDNFLNNALLRLPPRVFSLHENVDPQMNFEGNAAGLEKDARITSGTRYFSRDAAQVILPGGSLESRRVALVDDRFGGFSQGAESGVGGWNDFSGVSIAARDALREAAGISIPESSFVWQVMAVYLIALVPVNWGFFWMLRRLEWAWLAAPVIAIVGSVAVVRLAQLDIGFVRSSSQVAVLESHADYDRAHLTRYAALYTSLSTRYNVIFEDSSALAQPFSDSPDFVMRINDRIKNVSFRRDRDVALRGFTVESNQTDMLHCEEMFNLKGTFSLAGDESKGWKVNNGTRVNVTDAVVVRGVEKPVADAPSDGTGGTVNREVALEIAWIGDLPANSSVPLSFAPPPSSGRAVAQWDDSETMRHSGVEGELHLGRLADMAAFRLSLSRGEMRLIGWTGEELPGVQFEPGSSQASTKTLVLAHLQHSEFARVGSDKNLLLDYEIKVNETDPESLFPLEENPFR